MVRHWNRALATERDPRRRRQMHRSRAINAVGAVLHRPGAGDRAGHQVHPRRLPGGDRDARAVRADARASAATTTGSPANSHRTPAGSCCPPGSTRSCWCPGCTGRPCGRWPSPGRPARTPSPRSPSRPRRTRSAQLQARVGRARHPGAADRPGLPVPGHHRPGAGLRRASCAASARATWSSSTSPSTSSGHWWEHLLHNQSALRLKARLLFQPGVMVTSVPWQLESSRSQDKPDSAARSSAAPVDGRSSGRAGITSS